jgi:hypothetical protein
MKKSPQHIQVIETMKKNGGYATLGFLYQHVDVTKWGTKTPFKSINRIVQDSRFFFKLRPGLWALLDQKIDVLKKFEIEIEIEKEKDLKSLDFSHYYFQGLLVEIGNIKGFKTFIPNQDKNKMFLDQPLGQISTIESIFPFSFDYFIKRAKTIDVIWFNERMMPSSFFEVEHSTDIYNSLLKFSDLRDFYSSFCIVADQVRKREFESKISSYNFKEIKERITFMSYESLSQIHANTFKLMKAQEGFSFLK